MLRMSVEEFEARRRKLDALGHVRTHTLAGSQPGKQKGRASRKTAKKSILGESHLLAAQAKKAGLPAPQLEYRFHSTRRWRLDLAFVEAKLAVEIEGGAWIDGGGRHNRGSGYLADLEKYNAVTIAGWRLLRFTPRQVRQGVAIEMVARLWTRS